MGRFSRWALGALVVLSAWPAAAPAATTPQEGAPSCAEGPKTVGETTFGTPCDDTIHAPPGVATVRAGGGDDMIVAAPIGAAAECPAGCHLGVGSQTFDGGPGNDVVYGERGNDTLNGGEGNDRLYGGIGDDRLRGGPGNDLLSGGFGADSLDGESGDDFVRGDATVDTIGDSGGGADTLSFSTGVTPGFPNESPFFESFVGFPQSAEGRGVFIELGKNFANDGVPPDGGGVDKPPPGRTFDDFETVIGTPFSDFIVGTAHTETIYGGGGADVIRGEGGGDHLVGGAEGDSCSGAGGGSTECETGAAQVTPRDPTKIAAGLMAPGSSEAELYLSGSNGGDEITASYSPGSVTFHRAAGGAFDTAAAGCNPPTPTELVCPFSGALDSIVLAGLGGDDTLVAAGFPDSTAVILLGGDGGDRLSGGSSEDVLVDGPGDDESHALDGDDALLANAGLDRLFGGNGNDLFLSNALCDGDLIEGEDGRDNASWARLQASGVEARLDQGIAGKPGPGGAASCSGGAFAQLHQIEDLEGSEGEDVLVGESGRNQLLGHAGADSYFAEAGDDTILANSGDPDLVIDCGEGTDDTAFVDLPQFGDPPPSGCETIFAANPESFEPPGTPPALPTAAPPPPSEPTARPPDRRAPRTRILRHPPKLVFTAGPSRTVSFAFASNEPGATFRCKLDRGPFKACGSPRRYRVRTGLHAVRIFAVDAAGNRDRSPALFKFQVRRR
jgi:Ca2+-binding RTX toxin-like protein